jgi:hypothetical protein
MDYKKKYIKYKNKYLNLKGGLHQNDVKFIEDIKKIIEKVSIINYINSKNLDDTKRRLIFNILLYSGFIFKKETIKDGFSHERYELIENDGFFNFYNNDILCILKNHFENPQYIIEILLTYSRNYYDNFPEIFNYNSSFTTNTFTEKYLLPNDINELFCLIITIIQNSSDNVEYFDLLINTKQICQKIEEFSQTIDLDMNFETFIEKFNENLLNKVLVPEELSNKSSHKEYIKLKKNKFNNDNKYNSLDKLCKINFKLSKGCNNFILFNIPKLDKFDNELMNYMNLKMKDAKITVKYKLNDINDFVIIANNNDIEITINNLIDKMPNIFYIINLSISHRIILDYIYNESFINIEDNNIKMFWGILNENNKLKLRNGLIRGLKKDEFELFSSYFKGIKSKCEKDNFEKAKSCIYFPILTDHNGLLAKFNNGDKIINILSLNISEYQEKNHSTSSVPLDGAVINYFSRIKDILYLLVKVLKKEDIEFCVLQELLKNSPEQKSSLTEKIKDKIFEFIKSYLILYNYNIINAFPYYNYIIYKQNYKISEDNIIKNKDFTSIFINNICICSLKFPRSISKMFDNIRLLLVCIAATIFNKYENCNQIIILGDFNLTDHDGTLKLFKKDCIINGSSSDHVIIINRMNMLYYINSLKFENLFFSEIIKNISEWFNNDSSDNVKEVKELIKEKIINKYFENFAEVQILLNDSKETDCNFNTYYYLKIIFLIYYYKSKFTREYIIPKNTYFHDFSDIENLIVLYDNLDNITENKLHGYLWELIIFLHKIIPK